MDISSVGSIAYNKFLAFAEEEAQEEVKEGEEEKGVDDLDALNNLIIENGALEAEGLFVPEGAFDVGSESHGVFSHSVSDVVPTLKAAPAEPAILSTITEAPAEPAVLPTNAAPAEPAITDDETDSSSSSPTMDQMTNEMSQAEMQQFNNNMVNSAKSELSEIQAEQKKEWQTASDANSAS